MDLRSIKPGLSAAPMVRIHPLTGEPIVPLGVTKHGKPIWPVMGGAPDDDEDKSGDDDKSDDDEDEDDDEDDKEDDDSDDDDSEEEEDDDDKAKGKKKKNAQAKIKALEEEKDRHYKKFKVQKKRADDLEARIKAIEEKDLKPEEKEARRKKEQDEKDSKAEIATQRLRLENAFLRANEINWVKPEQALTILLGDDDYEVEFNEDGTVDRKSLRAELKRLAKANPHLVKKAAPKDDDKGGEDATDNGSQRQTASSMNGKRKGKKDDKPTREQLAKKFPVLNRL